jgi:hypothetical protein
VADRDIAALERRGRAVAIAVGGTALLLLATVFLGVTAGGIDNGSMFRQPRFPHAYTALDSRLSHYAVVLVPLVVVAMLLLWRLLGVVRSLMAAGGAMLLCAVVIAAVPLSTARGSSCKSVIGRWGASDETCYDIRRAADFDVVVLGAVGGVTLGAVGVAAAATRAWHPRRGRIGAS